MMPPLRKWRGPAANWGDGVHQPTDPSPSHSVLRWRPSGLSAPQPQQKLFLMASWKAVTASDARAQGRAHAHRQLVEPAQHEAVAVAPVELVERDRRRERGEPGQQLPE